MKSHGDYNSHSSPNCDIHQMFHLVQKQTYTLVKVSMMKFKVLIERDEDGWHIATVPSLPGCISHR
ncbi:MAG: type II toxin-antitoxin system HicB family antitoxin [Methanosarcinales archaeon Met12]|nr:MAG: type II toxin-antitoxin system HicB family antitoxin [Methanosarcinales archaeon Met12]